MVAFAAVVISADPQSEAFCRQFPSLALCKLPAILQGSYDELQYLLAGADQLPQMSQGPQNELLANTLQKRKSAFVRFGKRSVEETQDMPEKRKSAFVRFGRSDPELLSADMEKRKSNYVRFG
ncbi:unnamed protein product, partial [Mesorhabditis spiculigera]